LEEIIMSIVLDELMYTGTHEWIKTIDKDTVEIGITDFAQHELGDIVFVNLPKIGDEVVIAEVFSDVESVKAVSDIYSPVSGDIYEINELLLDNPALLNSQPYDAWLVRVNGVTAKEDFLTKEEYEDLLAKEA
jgi:glycine cleavage system H protein